MTEASTGPVSRVVNVVLSLLQAHIALAKAEAQRDTTRLLLGVVLLLVGAISFVHVWVLLHVLAVIGLHAIPLPWGAAVGIVAGFDALVGITCVLVARSKLTQPVMQESRELLRRTLEVAKA